MKTKVQAPPKPSAMEESLKALEVRMGKRCPECNATKPESNGRREYRCVACDHRWGFEYGEQYGF